MTHRMFSLALCEKGYCDYRINRLRPTLPAAEKAPEEKGLVTQYLTCAKPRATL